MGAEVGNKVRKGLAKKLPLMSTWPMVRVDMNLIKSIFSQIVKAVSTCFFHFWVAVKKANAFLTPDSSVTFLPTLWAGRNLCFLCHLEFLSDRYVCVEHIVNIFSLQSHVLQSGEGGIPIILSYKTSVFPDRFLPKSPLLALGILWSNSLFFLLVFILFSSFSLFTPFTKILSTFCFSLNF